jgi:hypothetical protein
MLNLTGQLRENSGFILNNFSNAEKVIKPKQSGYNNWKEVIGPYPDILIDNFEFYNKNEKTGRHEKLPSNEVEIYIFHLINIYNN